jgi:hypothetical protein
VDPSGDGVGGLTATGPVCASCGAQSNPTAKFCSECGARLTQAPPSAEYKQATVLFADVVHSMDIAAAVGTERLREIMAAGQLREFGRAGLRRDRGPVHRGRTDGGLGGTRGAGRPPCSPFEVALGFTPWIRPCDGPTRKSIAAQLALQSQM